ncbi:MAG: glutamate 5-kinase [Candidatus Lambdaproteobacteria bacterium RIFOXYD1_FULL_56_27]|uniref:Glutamate 5-kinase n=1 Tax=Candidatus Lambdaproteobacteria bacterium RIFOXYD2_FULL_56_26 TaxID=1817773 RepID=A0A1F6H1X4_9PROT|nr:MAG: glutamate 5-kinase [Candidatus Lambdaproteobacteria bacterium RIFOXYC1_FULL_56_13]OGH04352.1 MAG: glutamate 5-kinase [Candidatus Lambdaproteobacteria bacterium RIFOXYD2_FULL_56_26]OGH08673.1 MAG: glutamate 5-kinase [Candidatus Lambdaproteobacteria bacterium RIFOXYD1_FULL_56_27]
MKKPRVVVKVGTNVLTRPDGGLDHDRIADLTRQLAELQGQAEVILVSSGAVGAGREFQSFAGEKDPVIKKQMLAAIGQGRLFQVYADFFKEQSVLPAQALITRYDFKHPEAYQNIKATLEGLLRNGILPIINENDVVSFEETTFSDNDQLAALTAAMLGADLLVILSVIDGFFTADPHEDPKAKLIEEVKEISPELWAYCQDSLSKGGTGGMLSKLKAAETSTRHGIRTIVASGRKAKVLASAFAGEPVGTLFLPQARKPLSPKRDWMVNHAQTLGKITVDQGAEKALKSDKSLLAVGVTLVSGEFKKKDVLMIESQTGIRLGVGLAAADSATIREMLNERPQGAIVIHKNHLYLF